jgi:putative two-component system response regulator
VHADDLATISAGRSGSDYKVALHRVAAELRRRRQESACLDHCDWFLSALKAILSIRGSGNLLIRMEALTDCFAFFHLNDRPADALQATSALIKLSKNSADEDWARKAYQFHGTILAEVGRIADAVIAYATALEHARVLGNPSSEARTLINLGVAFNYGAFYREAIPCFTTALEKLELSPVKAAHDPCAALSNLAQSHFFLGNYAEGYELIKESLRRTQKSMEMFEVAGNAVRQFTAFRFSIELSDLVAAKRYLDECVRCSVISGTVQSKFIAQLATGLYEIYTGGDSEHGFSLLNDALHRSRNVGSYYEEALAALVRAYDRVGHPELALEHMHLLLAHLAKMRGASICLPESPSGSQNLMSLQLQESRLRTKVAQRRMLSSQVEMLERLAVTADLKEEASGEHGYRVGRLSSLVGERLNWTAEACNAIDLAARLHDIGKIAMPDRILLTSEQLKEAERHLMSTHTLVGAELLAKSDIPELQMAEEIAKFHHEWWNGEGYPSKRREKRIPIHARIVAIADVFDALTHGRPFADPWPIDRAVDEIRNRRGTQFDPELTDVFLGLISTLRAEHKDLDEYLGKAGKYSSFLQARNKIRLMLAERDPERETASKAPETVH